MGKLQKACSMLVASWIGIAFAEPELDRSGAPQQGKASYYGKQFFGRKMADGTPMDPHANIAASRTLPLGTRARVTNLHNGRSAEIEIRDRGPYVAGRIIDLSPRVAQQLGFLKQGLATVEVHPLEVPPPVKKRVRRQQRRVGP